MRCVYDDLYIVRVGNHHLLRHAAGQDFLIVGNFQQFLKGHFHVLSQYSGVDLLGIIFPRNFVLQYWLLAIDSVLT